MCDPVETPKKATGLSGDIVGGVSKIFRLLIGIITLISLIAGAVFWIVHQNDMLAQGQALNTQAIRNNTEAIKALTSKHDQGVQNFDRLLNIIAREHN